MPQQTHTNVRKLGSAYQRARTDAPSQVKLAADQTFGILISNVTSISKRPVVKTTKVMRPPSEKNVRSFWRHLDLKLQSQVGLLRITTEAYWVPVRS